MTDDIIAEELKDDFAKLQKARKEYEEAHSMEQTKA